MNIAVVQGAPGPVIQAMFRDLAARWAKTHRIVGVTEDISTPDGPNCKVGQLISLSDGAHFSLFQELGRGSTACNVHPEGALSAGEAVRRDIESGCDLAILSKFGKLEAEMQGGLVPAFVAAFETGAPILTSVSPRYEAEWRQFTEDMYVILPPDAGALDAWREQIWVGRGAKR
jgi:hypothetical protein